MSAAAAIALARSSGFQLTIDAADRVGYEAPAPASPIVLETLRLHKAEVIELLRAERRAIVQCVNDHFRSSPLGQCGHCDGGNRIGQFVAVFVGVERADIHAACYIPRRTERETHARVALAIERQNGAQQAAAIDPSPKERQFAFRRQMNGA